MRRTTAIPQEDSTCSNLRLNYKTLSDFNSKGLADLNPLANSISGESGSLIESKKNSNKTEDTQYYTTKLRDLQLLENKLNQYIKCINNDIILRNDFASRIYNLQQEIENLRKEVKDKKQIVNEAKERSDQIENPYNNTTWWETWFPLGRPIQKENVPVLISVSILMLVFSLGIFLRFAGKELRFESIGSSTNSLLKNINSRKYQV